MGDLAIRAVGLTKQYRIGRRLDKYRTLRDSVADFAMAPFRAAGRILGRGGDRRRVDESFFALRDVSFEVRAGEVVALIGRNGAGKSTLLKVLSRITEPTTGYAEVRGRVGSLLEVGTGFHPELTGRENIYLSGAILGMQRREITRRFDEIVAFAEVGRFIDTPVKHYSSGMYLRLAFAVAAHLEPEILLVDEVLAIGDTEFQQKCLGKMQLVAGSGRTVLFVSHNMAAVANLCHRGIIIAGGEIQGDGPVEEMIRRYLRGTAEVSRQSVAERTDREGSGEMRIRSIWMEDASGAQVDHARSGEELVLVFHYRCVDGWVSPRCSFKFMLRDPNRVDLAFFSTFLGNNQPMRFSGEGVIRCRIPRLPLAEGEYSISYIAGAPRNENFDAMQDAFVIRVAPGDFFGTGFARPFPPSVYIDHSFEVTRDGMPAGEAELGRR